MVGHEVIRRPSVAGYFYPEERSELARTIDALVGSREQLGDACAIIVPHGSYTYAGAVSGRVFARVRIPRRCILVGPSHTGCWLPWSVIASGAYRTPLGDVLVDERCAGELLCRCGFLTQDPTAQQGEHSIEVPLPFLQRLGPRDLTIVPIICQSEELTELDAMAKALAQVVRLQEEPVLLVVSADLSQYRAATRVRAQDARLLEAITTLDAATVRRHVQDDGLSLCGVGALVCVLKAASRLGASRAELLAYGTSADTGGDPHSTTGYAGLRIID